MVITNSHLKIAILLITMIIGMTLWLGYRSQPEINPWAWKVNYSANYNIWKVICDEQTVNEKLLHRCYLRWVDVFAERPKFGALFVFITPANNYFNVEFHPEPGSIFTKDGFKIVANQQTLWQLERASCLQKSDCKLRDDETQNFFAAIKQGEYLKFEVVDKYDRQFTLSWPLDGFVNAIDDLAKQSQLRNL